MRKSFLSALVFTASLTLSSCGTKAPAPTCGPLDLPSVKVAIRQHETILTLKPGIPNARVAWTSTGGDGSDDLASDIALTDVIGVGCAENISVREVSR